jgi:hypothetical protein
VRLRSPPSRAVGPRGALALVPARPPASPRLRRATTGPFSAAFCCIPPLRCHLHPALRNSHWCALHLRPPPGICLLAANITRSSKSPALHCSSAPVAPHRLHSAPFDPRYPPWLLPQLNPSRCAAVLLQMLHNETNAAQCVVTGDGAVGKVRRHLLHRLFPANPADMPPHLVHNQCLSRRVHSHSVSPVPARERTRPDPHKASTTTQQMSWSMASR